MKPESIEQLKNGCYRIHTKNGATTLQIDALELFETDKLDTISFTALTSTGWVVKGTFGGWNRGRVDLHIEPRLLGGSCAMDDIRNEIDSIELSSRLVEDIMDGVIEIGGKICPDAVEGLEWPQSGSAL